MTSDTGPFSAPPRRTVRATLQSNPGYADVLVGLQYGDEGKAKIVDFLAPDYDCIARFNGGANAGHTISSDRGTVALRQIPSGVFREGVMLYVGSGCVVDPVQLADELAMLESIGVSLRGRLHLSGRASVIQPHHSFLDRSWFGEIGTTGNGIGVAYAEKALRMLGRRVVNVRLGDLAGSTEHFMQVVGENLRIAALDHPSLASDAATSLEQFRAATAIVLPYVQDDSLFLARHIQRGGRVLFEGAQSVGLDVTHGTVPYVTSSSTLAAAAFTGGDAPVWSHRKTIGVAKAIMSRVGNGPFVSEYGGPTSESYCNERSNGLPAHPRETERGLDIATALRSSDAFEVGKALRVLSDEYGTGTRRPRRIGVFDAVQLAHAVTLNGVNEVYINKCDLLHHYAYTQEASIPLVTGYTLHGEPASYLPTSENNHRQMRPVLEHLPLVLADKNDATSLWFQLRNWIERIEQVAECKVVGIGSGPGRKDLIHWNQVSQPD